MTLFDILFYIPLTRYDFVIGGRIMTKKKLICGIIIFLMVLLPSISAINVERPNFNKIKTSNTNEFDKIFYELKEKMKDVNTREECNVIFKDALIKLDKNGLLGDIQLEDAIKLIINNDEDTYSVYGESTRTNLLEGVGVFCYVFQKTIPLPILVFICGMTWSLFLQSINLPYQSGSWITYGYGVGNWEGRIDYYEPAEGYIKYVGSDGEKELNGTFYGQILELDGVDGFGGEHIKFHFVGLKGFKGWSFGNYYFGTAKEINIGINEPYLI